MPARPPASGKKTTVKVMAKSSDRWEELHVDLGSISTARRSVWFRSSIPLDDALEVRASCGCSVPRVDHDRIRVDCSPAPVPHHLKGQSWYETEKRVRVAYGDGTEDVLSFSARVLG